ncbi:MAG TPA: Rrf2 family transcriptional regulator [Solirubrobacterales bacterium]|nr:Rrf2 family transcriptional regulator [Solirubrobacterales bacterium]
MRISAKVDYAVRAAVELAAAEDEEPIKGEVIAEAQGIPLKFLENILGELKHVGIVKSRRGAQGGYWLAKPANEVSLGDIVRAVEGPLASVRGEGPEDLEYKGGAAPLQRVWIALRANLRAVMDEVSLADVVADELPVEVRELSEPAEAWSPR